MSLIQFGPHLINDSHIFYKSLYSVGIVNIRPVVPGHVLIISKRQVARLKGLTNEEAADFFCACKLVGNVIEKKYNASSLSFVIQDGGSSGQTVPHIHMHIIPRYPDDFQPNDLIYDVLEKKGSYLDFPHKIQYVSSGKCNDGPDATHFASRTFEEMALEAASLSSLLMAL